MPAATPTTPLTRKKNRSAFWKKQARIWHWMSGAVCLIGMLLFALTGITLNHAAQISAEPQIVTLTETLPPPLLADLNRVSEQADDTPIPRSVRRHLKSALDINIGPQSAEWTDLDVYVPLPRPGGDAWLAIDRGTGEIEYELTRRGTIAYLNDLHKGRNTGSIWVLFLDVFSVATILFCLTGLWLLQIHAKKRATTWPLMFAGLILPALIAIIFIH